MKKVAVIQDLSSFGKCSLTAALPVLSVMGVQACPLPTAVLSAQTAYDHYFCQDLTDEMLAFTEHWAQMNAQFDGIQTGFVTGKAQIAHILQFLNQFQQQHTTVLIDPVLGDDGEQYKMFSYDLLDQMKALIKRATIVTPNVTECCLLTDTDYIKLYQYDETYALQKIKEAGQKLQAQTNATVIITGVETRIEGAQYIGNMIVDETSYMYTPHLYHRQSYSGTGDLFAAVVMGAVMNNQPITQGVALAQQFLAQSIAETAKTTESPKAGVAFEKHLHLLMHKYLHN
ncbi:pyridoxamine kinase [Kurthia massiliensis]|uniref:pyridoxamine kinase n=1 Tax=Kurthia massiliensis TaxID=1033739 RepID=UPI00028850EA|nr:pyridoxamine kinase [Kurthia massiliensis]